MKLLIRIFFAYVTVFALSGWASGDICRGLYGEHTFFHHTLNGAGDTKFSDPKMIEIEIKSDGSVIGGYHFEDHVEGAVFSNSFPQITYFNRVHTRPAGCLSNEAECAEVRHDLKGFAQTLDSLIYIDITKEEDVTPNPNITIERQRVLTCAIYLLNKISASIAAQSQN